MCLCAQCLCFCHLLQCRGYRYEMFHPLNLEWPCMTFDFIPDDLGFQRNKFPMTSYAYFGTQVSSGLRIRPAGALRAELHGCRTALGA